MPVMGMARSGGLAEYIAVPAAAIEIMPDGIAPQVGASFRANYLTSLYALSERGVLCAEEYLLVLGAAGGVGIAAVQIGKLLGARVIAAASTEEKRKFATRSGAIPSSRRSRAGSRAPLKRLTSTPFGITTICAGSYPSPTSHSFTASALTTMQSANSQT